MFQILILFGLILLNAFFAMAEIAIVTLNDKKIKKLSLEGHKGATKVLALIENSSDFLATIQVGVTLSGFLTSASASQSFSGPIADMLSFMNVPRNVLEIISTIIITVVLSYFSLVLGELVPKKIAMQNAEAVSFKVIGVLLLISKIFRPFILLLSASTNIIIRAMGMDPNANEQTVTEEEILMMVDAGEEKGMIEEKAKDMIINIFDFDNTTTAEIMTHRTDIIAIEDTNSVNDVVSIAIKNGFSRIPVFKEDLDDIIGVLYVKDLLKYVSLDVPKEAKIIDIMRPVMFVPDSKRCNELFAEFTAQKIQIAIVVDEYGGTEGLITMEDLVESIVGNIQDEYDNEDDDIRKINENTFTVDGTTPIDEIENITGLKLPEGDYDTIAGFMVNRLGRIPKIGEHPYIILEDSRITVQEVTERRISKVQIFKEPAIPETIDET